MDALDVPEPLEVLLPDGMLPHVVGKEHKNITRIRNESGARLKTGIRRGNEGEQIEYVLISGSEDQQARAKELVIATVAKAQQTELKLLLPHGMVPYVIGKKGKTINEIRDESGAHLKFCLEPDADGEAVHHLYIWGTEDQLKTASRLVRLAMANVTRHQALDVDRPFTTVKADISVDKQRDVVRQEARDRKAKIGRRGKPR